MTAAPSAPDGTVRPAVVLAAGNGDRFQNLKRQSKVVQRVLGGSLILRTIETAGDAASARSRSCSDIWLTACALPSNVRRKEEGS